MGKPACTGRDRMFLTVAWPDIVSHECLILISNLDTFDFTREMLDFLIKFIPAGYDHISISEWN